MIHAKKISFDVDYGTVLGTPQEVLDNMSKYPYSSSPEYQRMQYQVALWVSIGIEMILREWRDELSSNRAIKSKDDIAVSNHYATGGGIKINFDALSTEEESNCQNESIVVDPSNEAIESQTTLQSYIAPRTQICTHWRRFPCNLKPAYWFLGTRVLL